MREPLDSLFCDRIVGSTSSPVGAFVDKPFAKSLYDPVLV